MLALSVSGETEEESGLKEEVPISRRPSLLGCSNDFAAPIDETVLDLVRSYQTMLHLGRRLMNETDRRELLLLNKYLESF